eukprot:Hpha_TRINITY_DN11825_c0_g1::TRINITY_DN11825_c0_g1_i1::g.2018::m.2018
MARRSLKQSARRRAYRCFVARVARSMAQGKWRLGRDAGRVVSDFAHDMFHRIAGEARGLVSYAGHTRMSAGAVQSATRLVLNGELARHAVLAGRRAVASHRRMVAAARARPARTGPPGATPPPRATRASSNVHSAPTAPVSLATPRAVPEFHEGAATVRDGSTPAVSLALGVRQAPLASTAVPSAARVAAWLASAPPVCDEDDDTATGRDDSQSAGSHGCCQFCGGAVPSYPLVPESPVPIEADRGRDCGDVMMSHGDTRSPAPRPCGGAVPQSPLGRGDAALPRGGSSGPCGRCLSVLSPAPSASTPIIPVSRAAPPVAPPTPDLYGRRVPPLSLVSVPAAPQRGAPAAGHDRDYGTATPPHHDLRSHVSERTDVKEEEVKQEPIDPSPDLSTPCEVSQWRTPRAGRPRGVAPPPPLPPPLPYAPEECGTPWMEHWQSRPTASPHNDDTEDTDDAADTTTEHSGSGSRTSPRDDDNDAHDVAEVVTKLESSSPTTVACSVPLPALADDNDATDSLTLQCVQRERRCFTDWRNELAPAWAATAGTRDDLPGWDAFIIRNAFSAGEMHMLIKAAEAEGFGRLGDSAQRGHRQHLRLTCVDGSLAEAVSKRLGRLFPQEVIDEEGRHWRFLGLYEQWRVAKYNPGDHFAVHSDRYYERCWRERSMYAVSVFMSGGHSGGRTRFFFPGNTPAFTVTPEPGKALVYRLPPAQEYLHEEETLLSGTKYLLRTEAMYTLLPRPCLGPLVP